LLSAVANPRSAKTLTPSLRGTIACEKAIAQRTVPAGRRRKNLFAPHEGHNSATARGH
jgi:hypothetical protein